jgi:hypothetical protein
MVHRLLDEIYIYHEDYPMAHEVHVDFAQC